MPYDLAFDTLLNYDTGVPGISIEVELRVDDSSVLVSAKVDTGSDRCIFARNVGEQLGFEIESGELQVFGTATGSFVAYGHPITLITAGYEFDSTVYFASDESFDRSVLGRFGWLDRMVLGVNDYDGKLYLSSYR